MVERTVEILNDAGLHARPVMRFVDLASKYQASIRVAKTGPDGGERVDGKSPMEMMLLEAPQGTTLHISATGNDAEEMVLALVELVANRFEEQ
ncbi:MAG: HPr family phosphocarrier protein [bacterium]|nr:HPr family phosphocarrier protein [bacterium]